VKRRRLNLVLAATAAALGVAVYFSSREKAPGPPLTKYKADAVTRIVIAHPQAAVITLERHDQQWALTSPVKTDADPLEAAGLAALAEKETKEKLEPSQLKLAELKLDPPDYTVTFNDAPVAVGGVEPLEYRRYVKTADGVYLIEDPPGAPLDADYADLVAKTLFPEKSAIVRIEVPGLTVGKDQNGKWQALPADPKKTKPAALQKFVDGWQHARAMWNELPPKDNPPAGEPVKVTLQGGATYSFAVAAREPQFKLYRADAGTTFVLSKALADDLLKLPEPAAPAAPPTGTAPGSPLPAPAEPPSAPEKTK